MHDVLARKTEIAWSACHVQGLHGEGMSYHALLVQVSPMLKATVQIELIDLVIVGKRQ